MDMKQAPEEKLPKWRLRWQALSEQEKKRYRQVFALFIIGVVLLCCSSDKGRGREPTSADRPEEPAISAGAFSAEVELEKRLEEILSKIKGVGDVQVMIRYSHGISAVYATENDVAVNTGESEAARKEATTLAVVDDAAVLVRQDAPTVQGVIVVAEGAGDPLVTERIYEAVKSLLGLGLDKIAVIEGEV